MGTVHCSLVQQMVLALSEVPLPLPGDIMEVLV
jgi:hypothetical protein